jgi:hypothetical protein
MAVVAGTTQYNSSIQALQVYNGSTWITLGAPSCNSAFVGSVRYDASVPAMEYCDGSSWQQVATATATATATSTQTQPPFHSSTACGGYYCQTSQTNANAYCQSIGMNSAASYSGGGPGCNSCYYVNWNGSNWGSAANHCNSCSFLSSVTCQ